MNTALTVKAMTGEWVEPAKIIPRRYRPPAPPDRVMTAAENKAAMNALILGFTRLQRG